MSKYIAHINDKEEIQTVETHLRNVAELTSLMLKPMGLTKTGYITGLLHDLGKYTNKFSQYICDAHAGKTVIKGSVNHTFAGVQYLLKRYHEDCSPWMKYTTEIIGFAIGSHHGLFDCIDTDNKNGFEYRLNKDGIFAQEAVQNFETYCSSETEIAELINSAEKEIESLLTDMMKWLNSSKADEIMFSVGLVSRLVLSALIDADREDTAAFMMGPHREKTEPSWNSALESVEDYLERLKNDSEIGVARSKISGLCKDAASEPPQIWRLNVPTGGGKTLSSLRFALAHSEKYRKEHIFFVAPLLSIIDQNAMVIKTAIDDKVEILEHHSNVISESLEKEESDTDFLRDNWDSDVTITTLVQLLNTMFSAKTSSVRRFHSLANSILVVDEVQTVPGNMLSLFNSAMNFLANTMNTTIVLCSATQPCLEETKHPIYSTPRDMVPFDETIWKVFKRTELIVKEAMDIEEISDFVDDLSVEKQSILIVCNTKKTAAGLYEKLKSSHNCYHLSAAMCMEHRRNIVSQIKENLETRQKIICVSTQVIEAGVDISFEAVIRLTAGMDSIIQAAGRCNRNAESKEPAPVFIIECKGENLKYLKTIQEGKNATIALLAEFMANPESLDGNLSGDSSIHHYYKNLFSRQKENYQDYIVGRESLFDLLSTNDTHRKKDTDEDYYLNQAFKTAGAMFKIFDDDSTGVIVPYGDGRNVIEDLLSERAKYDMQFLQDSIQRAKPYTVNIYNHQVDQLKREDGIRVILDGMLMVLLPEYYSGEIGIMTTAADSEYLEV